MAEGFASETNSSVPAIDDDVVLFAAAEAVPVS